MTEVQEWFVRNFVDHTVPFWLFLVLLFMYGFAVFLNPLVKVLLEKSRS
jgi:hypothetical protein